MDSLSEKTLLYSEEKQQEILQLIFLKLMALWMERQEWVASYYGGQNPVQDMIFQSNLVANQNWKDFFSGKKKVSSTELVNLKRRFIEMSGFPPEIRDYFIKWI